MQMLVLITGIMNDVSVCLSLSNPGYLSFVCVSTANMRRRCEQEMENEDTVKSGNYYNIHLFQYKLSCLILHYQVIIQYQERTFNK